MQNVLTCGMQSLEEVTNGKKGDYASFHCPSLKFRHVEEGYLLGEGVDSMIFS